MNERVSLVVWSNPGTFAEIQTRALAYTEFRYRSLQSELRMRVKACSSAHVAFFSGANHDTASQSYELVIGGFENTRTYIIR